MESINKNLKSDASYASKNMVVDMSVTTSTTKLAMNADTSSAINSGKTTRERTSKKVSRNATSGNVKQPRSKGDSPQKVHPVQNQTSNVVGGTVHLSLSPFDVKNAPLSFTQMEQIQATIIDMMIEHNRREINAESLNCQFKTGWMAFKCNTATAEWLKLNCNNISQKCKVKLNLVEEINQDEKNLKQNQTKSTRSPHLKRGYYTALHHLKALNKARENGEPLNNAKLIRMKYESMIEDYLETQNNARKLRKILVLEGVLDRPKKARPLHKRYRMALHSLHKLKKIEESGTPLDENKLASRRRLQGVVDEFLKEQRENRKIKIKNPNQFRPFHETITDPLCMAVGGKRKGLFVPISKEWLPIEAQIHELVTSYVSENQDDGPVPRYDLKEIHRGFRVIKCMDEFSKKFLFKCIASIKDNWKELNLMIIPASQIPKTRRDPIDLKGEAAMKKIIQTTNIRSLKGVKTIPSASVSTSDGTMDYQTPLKYSDTKKTAALQHPQTSNPFRSLEFQTPQHHDLMDSPRDLPTQSYLAQQPQNSRNTTEFSIENRFNPLGSSDFTTHSHAVSTKISENFTENSTFGAEVSPISGRTKNYLNPAVESEFSDRFPASNESFRRRSDRNDGQSHILTTSGDWRRSPDFYANPGSKRTQFYQDSFPDSSNPYNIDRLPASSRRSSERNSVQTHTLNISDDWRRSPDFYENSRSNVNKFYQDSSPHCSNAYRNDRWLEPNEISMRSRERIPNQSQTLANSESRWRSSDFYENSNSPSGCNRSLYRNDREPSPHEISMWNRKSNPTLMDSERRRKSPDFHAKLIQSYKDFPPHYDNPYRNSSSSDSFNNRYHKLDSFDISSTEAAKHNVRGKESYRSDEFYTVSERRDFEPIPNYFSQTDSRNNNSYSRKEQNYLPSDDDDTPPPPPRWN